MTKADPRPRVLKLASGKAYQRLLAGPPATAGLRSGRVTLAPGQTVGRHTTGAHEEVLVVLRGRGAAECDGRRPLSLSVRSVAYIPPMTEHDVRNTGKTGLEYVYLVAPIRTPLRVR
ncbi:MAG: cupin domain-containing protein [Elusimicrobia bacterium]|nr:cupin domain-containing protein [Elusimicrobiota bacterium]